MALDKDQQNILLAMSLTKPDPIAALSAANSMSEKDIIATVNNYATSEGKVFWERRISALQESINRDTSFLKSATNMLASINNVAKASILSVDANSGIAQMGAANAKG